MMGIRIICTFLEDVSDVKDQIKELFDVKEIEIKEISQKSAKLIGNDLRLQFLVMVLLKDLEIIKQALLCSVYPKGDTRKTKKVL